MVEPTNELILKPLQQIHETLAEHSRLHQEHTRRFYRIERHLEELCVSTATALGFAMHSNLRHESVAERQDELTRKVGSLEDLKRRVEVLERAK